jgi:hypothetical protein
LTRVILELIDWNNVREIEGTMKHMFYYRVKFIELAEVPEHPRLLIGLVYEHYTFTTYSWKPELFQNIDYKCITHEHYFNIDPNLYKVTQNYHEKKFPGRLSFMKPYNFPALADIDPSRYQVGIELWPPKIYLTEIIKEEFIE